LFSYQMIGLFFNNLTPGALGGDAVKAYYAYRQTGEGRYVLISVLLERFTGLLGLSVLSVAALAVGLGHLESPLVLAAVAGSALFLVLLMLVFWWPPLARRVLWLAEGVLPRRAGGRFRELQEALLSYAAHRRTLLAGIALSVVVQLLYA